MEVIGNNEDEIKSEMENPGNVYFWKRIGKLFYKGQKSLINKSDVVMCNIFFILYTISTYCCHQLLFFITLKVIVYFYYYFTNFMKIPYNFSKTL